MKPNQQFDRASLSYDSYSYVQNLCSSQLAYQIYMRFKHIPIIYDLGSGTGALTKNMLNFFPNSSYYLVDFAQNMLEESKKKFRVPLNYICSDLLSIDSIDFAMSNFALQWTNQIPKANFIACSIPIKGTWENWCKMANEYNFYTHPFLTQDEWIEKVKFHYKKIDFFTQIHHIYYPCIFSFIKQIKKTGVNAHDKKPQIGLHKILRHFQKGVHIKYKVLYLFASI